MKIKQQVKYMDKSPLFFDTELTLLSLTVDDNSDQLKKFVNFFLTCGGALQGKLLLGSLLQNYSFFMVNNSDFINHNYPTITGIVDEFFRNRLNLVDIFNMTIEIIKPPFVIKTTLIPKKLRKKTKQKYLVKIVYKNDSKRLSSAYKQLYYLSNRFPENKFPVRLYKSVVHTFFEWKQSYLFKLKTAIFKKFFKA